MYSKYNENKDNKKTAIIKVVGIGGAGGNAVQHMFNDGIVGVDFFLCNTDEQALQENIVPCKLRLGNSGLGAGSDPAIAQKYAEESEKEIRQMIGEDTKMLFITAGMGKGTGTGAAPVVARIAHEMGILTIAVVTYPYRMEQKPCARKADEGIAALRKYVDSLIIIQNQKVLENYRRETLPRALEFADDILKNAVKCIAELITIPGYQNVDFNDMVTILKESGEAMFGLAEAKGENRIEDVISRALTCNLLDDSHISEAQKILFFVRYDEDNAISVDELMKLEDEFDKYNNDNTLVIWGHAAEKGLGDSLKLSVIMTRFNSNTLTPVATPPENIFPSNDKVIYPKLPSDNPSTTEPVTPTYPVTEPELPLDSAESQEQIILTPQAIVSSSDDVDSAEMNVQEETPEEEMPSFTNEEETKPQMIQKLEEMANQSETIANTVLPQSMVVDNIECVADSQDTIAQEVPAETNSNDSQSNSSFDEDPFFQQSNAPAVTAQQENVATEIGIDRKMQEELVIDPMVKVGSTQMNRRQQHVQMGAGVVITDDGTTAYDDDEKFLELVNSPASPVALQQTRIVQVKNSDMKAVPSYTCEEVFFGIGATNAD